jgi:hypothetical protein
MDCYVRTAIVLGLLAVLSACTGGNRSDDQAGSSLTTPDPYADVIGANDKAMFEAEAAAAVAAADERPIEIFAEFDGATYGLVGDGRTDNTVMLQSLLAEPNRRVTIPPGDYVTGALTIPSNTILVLQPGVTLRDSGRLGEHQRLINILGENVRITGRGARVIADRGAYTTGEQRHGIFIYGAQHVLIEWLESSSHGGDGFYIGGDVGSPASDIVIKGCRADGNRRQGLSITSARRVWVIDCEFTQTQGTLPEFGIDIEPDLPGEVLDKLRLIRPRTWANRGGGIQIGLHDLRPTSEPVDIVVVDHWSLDESPRVHLHLDDSGQIPGRVLYDSE